MDGWVFALWGLGGGLAIEALDFIKAVRRVGHGWPWRYPYGPGGGPYLVSVLGRVVASAVVAGAAGASVNGMTPLVALSLGAAAPLILEKLSQQIPVHADLPMATPAAASPSVAAGAPALLQDPPARPERLSGQTEVTGPGGGA
ncbi:hypothetical protein DMB42_42265 [Nonomuraea sp. WAC 01424]|uniref:hypothetical protein n=1 Tax=Nonomuraea sp. WAC 01424 TaxID=2203200 RepID=UPI000F76692B|nr:hypothetical protein [Nonomuraea sp. WAC 01424]RSM99528.1 hypothetical protein DMB42_42265 [Nonomuraea sp. WAC 01424]